MRHGSRAKDTFTWVLEILKTNTEHVGYDGGRLLGEGVENTNGQDRNVTTNVMDEGQESTEKVEKTGELQEGLFGLH